MYAYGHVTTSAQKNGATVLSFSSHTLLSDRVRVPKGANSLVVNQCFTMKRCMFDSGHEIMQSDKYVVIRTNKWTLPCFTTYPGFDGKLTDKNYVVFLCERCSCSEQVNTAATQFLQRTTGGLATKECISSESERSCGHFRRT